MLQLPIHEVKSNLDWLGTWNQGGVTQARRLEGDLFLSFPPCPGISNPALTVGLVAGPP